MFYVEAVRYADQAKVDALFDVVDPPSTKAGAIAFARYVAKKAQISVKVLSF